MPLSDRPIRDRTAAIHDLDVSTIQDSEPSDNDKAKPRASEGRKATDLRAILTC